MLIEAIGTGALDQDEVSSQHIAIIGMACRFPQARTVDQYWQQLRDGRESIVFFSDEELLSAGIAPELLADPNYVKAWGRLEDGSMFDNEFFGVSPRDAEMMDPAHRIALECAWEALEHAGYVAATYGGSIGVFVGTRTSMYLLQTLVANPNVADPFRALIETDTFHLPTILSYKLNLTGPSVAVSSACSSSLVAVHLGCQSLLNQECDLVLAGGASIQGLLKTGYLYQEGGILSHDGRCRAFDARADGTVGGDGAGFVVLKRLEDALQDGDRIEAVIRGSAINNDGARKVGYMAPSVDAQTQVIVEAHTVADVELDTVSYIATHGTGTRVGDEIELAALRMAFAGSDRGQPFCALGSVKPNIGHLDAAAGVASLIKAVLALKHQQIPPSLHVDQSNPNLQLDDSPFFINTMLRTWEHGTTRRRAGVSAFGIGGTNAHLSLEEAPAQPAMSATRPWQLLTLSARTETALEQQTDRLAAHLKDHPELDLADVSYTLLVGRHDFAYRRCLVCRDPADAIELLERRAPQRIIDGLQDRRDQSLVFMFPGLGDHYVNMGRQLYEAEPVFRTAIERCCALLAPLLGQDLRAALYPVSPADSRTSEPPRLDVRQLLGLSEQDQPADTEDSPLDQTVLAQPALFVIEYALAQLWLSWGITPQAMIGYSLGEYVAACIAGVLTLEDALYVVVHRARLIQTLPAGAMLAASLSEAEALTFVSDDVSLSAVNGSAYCVLGGTSAAIEAVRVELLEREIASRRLKTSHAFHSALMEPILHEFEAVLRSVTLRPPTIPFISNVTGRFITAQEATSRAYWVRHLREPIRFADGLATLWQEPGRVALEVGPGKALTLIARQQTERPRGEKPIVVQSMRTVYDDADDQASLLTALGILYLAGIDVPAEQLYATEQRRRLALPSYPFEPQHYWIAPARSTAGHAVAPSTPQPKPDIADWFYVPSWQRVALPLRAVTEQQQRWLIFVDSCGLSTEIVRRLAASGHDVVTVQVGARFAQQDERTFMIDPGAANEYDALIQQLLRTDRLPEQIIHGWSMRPALPQATPLDRLADAQRYGFDSLILLAQSLDRAHRFDPLQLHVLTTDTQEVHQHDALRPEQTTISGVCKVMPQEYPNIRTQLIDVALPLDTPDMERLAAQLMRELAQPATGSTVAYRGAHRWVQTFAAVPFPEPASFPALLRQQGTYLLTGGLGPIGLDIARYLVATVQANLAITSTVGLPARESWPELLATPDLDAAIATRIRSVQELEASGSRVLVVKADVASEDDMQAVLELTRREFGALHGVIHAAGRAQESWHRTIAETDATVVSWNMVPKAHGLFVLERVLCDVPLDFCLLTSSLASILGGLGLAAYAAANIFMDAFTLLRQRHDATPWISLNLGRVAPGPALQLVLHRLFATGWTGQIIVEPSDLQAWLDLWITHAAPATSNHHPPARPLYRQGTRRTAYVAPTNETERVIIEFWRALLGVEEISIRDHFFELGGDSLLATQLMLRLRQAFQVTLSLRSVFESPTPEQLALVIEEAILQELEASSLEETSSHGA